MDLEYENRSLGEAAAREEEINRQSLADRKAAQKEFIEAMKDPALVGERISWLIDGNYGYGEMIKAKRIVAAPRMNRQAALTHLIAIYEWMCPAAMAAEAWKKLTKQEQQQLDEVVKIVIVAASSEMRKNGELINNQYVP